MFSNMPHLDFQPKMKCLQKYSPEIHVSSLLCYKLNYNLCEHTVTVPSKCHQGKEQEKGRSGRMEGTLKVII
jgi:hypothetical protein